MKSAIHSQDFQTFLRLSRQLEAQFDQLLPAEQAGLAEALPTLAALVKKLEVQGAVDPADPARRQVPVSASNSQMDTPQAVVLDLATVRALQESESSFRQLVEHSPYAITVQTDGFFVFVNPTGLKMYGLEHPDQMLGGRASEFVELEPGHYLYFESPEDWVRQSIGKFTRPDGSTGHFEALSVPLNFNGRPSTMGISRDLSEFRTAQIQQLRTEESFQTLVSAAPVGIVLSSDGKIIFANEAFLLIFGYPVTMELAGKPISDFYSPVIHSLDDRTRLRQQGQPLPPPFEFIGRKFDGSVVNLHLQGTRLQLKDGDAYLAFIFDITAQKEIQRQLERYRALAENSHDIMLFARASDGKILDANLAASKAYGYTHDEILTLYVADLRSRDSLEPISQQMQQANLEGIRFETRHMRKNGEIFPVEVNSQGVSLGGERLLLSVIRDMTEHVQAEQAIQESEARYRSLVEGLPDIVYSFSTRRGGIFYSPGVKAILGYSPEELVQSPFLWNQSILVEEKNGVETTIDGFLNQKDFELEYQIRDKQGNCHWFYDRSIRRREMGDEVIIDGIASDITIRKLTEAALLHQMEENVQHTAELEALADVSASMRQAENRSDMILLLVGQSITAMNALGGILALLDNNQLTVQCALGPLVNWEGRKLSQNRNIFWDVIQTGMPKYFEDPSQMAEVEDQAFAELHLKISACMLLPVKNGKNVIGLLFFVFEHPQHFLFHQKRLVTAIAEMAGNALHRMKITETLEGMVAARSRDLESIYRVTSAASETLELPVALQKALELTLAAVGAPIGGIFLYDETNNHLDLAARYGYPENIPTMKENEQLEASLEGWIIQNKKPIFLPDLSSDPRVEWSNHPGDYLAYIGLPMRLREKVVGVISILMISISGGMPLNLEEITLLSFVADHLGLVVENVRLFQRSEQHAVLEERSRLARELHDSVTQSLYSASLFSAGAKAFAARGNIEQTIQYIGQIEEISRQALRDMRLLVFELRSPILSTIGLSAALQNRLDAVERRAGILAIFEVAENLPMLSPKVDENLYRIAIEGLNNSLKHAAASQVDLSISWNGISICLRLSDNGAGFDLIKAAHSGGVGLTSMRERAEQMGGSFFITSDPGKGTKIEVFVPVSTTTFEKKLKGFDD